MPIDRDSYAYKLGVAEGEIKRLRAVILNIQALAEAGYPIDREKLATRCRHALNQEAAPASAE